MALDQWLVEILACPACRAKVRVQAEQIVCDGCGRRYPVRDGIPIMLISEATEPVASSSEKRA